MNNEFKSQTHQQLWHTIQKLNREWLNNKSDELAYYFHKDMVIAGTDMHELAHNRADCIQSYKDFMSKAAVHDYRESDPVVNIVGYSAVVSYRFDIDYTMKGKNHKESGRDLFVMIKEDERWQAVWRILFPDKQD